MTLIDPLRDPVLNWDPLPPTPAGHGPWQQVDQREYHRAWKDDLPCVVVDFSHGDVFEKRYFIAHLRGSRR